MINIDSILKEKGLNKTIVAERMGLSRESLYRILQGNPTLENIKKLADALEVSVSRLFSDDFTAMINHKGTMKQFDSVEELKPFLDDI